MECKSTVAGIGHSSFCVGRPWPSRYAFVAHTRGTEQEVVEVASQLGYAGEGALSEYWLLRVSYVENQDTDCLVSFDI